MKQAPNGQLSQFFYKRSICSTFVAVFLACAFILSACGGSNPSSSSSTSTPTKKGGNINVGLIAEPTTLDPLTSASLYDYDIMENMYDALLKYDANNKIQPMLAQSYEITDNGLTYTFHLRTDVKFQDGTPFNADAVLFNINRFIADKASPRITDVADISSMVKVNDSEVLIRLKKPFAPFLGVLTGDVGMMLSPTAVQKLGSKLGNTPTNVGSGPFIFGEWIKGDHLLLKANPNYWKKDSDGVQLPYLQTIRYHTITNATVMYNNLQTNQIQVASSIDPNNVAQIKSNSSLTYRQTPSPGFQSLQFNISQAPLNNIHLRRAIALAINRQEILDTVLKGVGFVAHGPLSPASWAYDKNYTGLDYDAAKAKAELAQSGVSNPSFTLTFTSGNPTTTQEVQLLQSQLQAVGITMSLKQETFTTVVTDFQTYHYQAVFIGWTGAIDPDGTMYSMFFSTGGFNYTNYKNSQVDSLLEAGRTTSDQAQRIPDYQKAQQLIVEDASRVFLTHPVVSQITTSSVKNYFLSPGGGIDLSSVYLAS
ncbi:MAG TPA: ABC transporter substrate-binding protein [Ktedonobacteraceae bacterium]|nr:ABC transporter substrate-binding protein [Ktedonobacteraceae bacterium]